MSYGERSCTEHGTCTYADDDKPHRCNVECPHYTWDGRTEKDTTTRAQKVEALQKAKAQKTTKTGRNDPCPCGSGKKYKKCCIRKERYCTVLFQCRQCGCVENMLKGWVPVTERMRAVDHRLLCSACAPTYYNTGQKRFETGFTGEWHGLFPRKYLKKNEYRTNDRGEIVHKGTGLLVDLEAASDEELS